MDWSKFFFFSWLAEEEELEDLRRENAELRRQLESQQPDDDYYDFDTDDHEEDYRDPEEW